MTLIKSFDLIDTARHPKLLSSIMEALMRVLRAKIRLRLANLMVEHADGSEFGSPPDAVGVSSMMNERWQT
jgi:hypothetical protein